MDQTSPTRLVHFRPGNFAFLAQFLKPPGATAVTTSLRVPPTERDTIIYEIVVIYGRSTRDVAEVFEISQTRVRQIVQRVLAWIGETLPERGEIDKQRELRLAQLIAADRFDNYYSTAMDQWRQKSDGRSLGMLLRITMATTRLGVMPGQIDALFADATEGPLPDDEITPTPPPAFETTNPPPGDCSPAPADEPPLADSARTTADATSASAPTSSSPQPAAVPPAEPAGAPRRPLLTDHGPLPVTSLRITPDEPGAVTLEAICRRLERENLGIKRQVPG
jgi:hypothetical protein